MVDEKTRTASLRKRLEEHKTATANLHKELESYSTEVGGQTAHALKTAISKHVTATGEFLDSALACVPPTG